MDLTEYLKQIRKTRALITPSYISQLRAISQNMPSNLIKNQMPESIALKFRDKYLPFKSILPTIRPVMPDLTILRIAEKLKTNVPNLSTFEYNLEDFIEGDIDEEELFEVVDNSKKIIKSIYEDNNLLNVLDPRKFEEIIAELLYAKGFEVSLTKQTKDNGYDIIALQKIGGFPIKFLVECKRYNKKRPIGINIIRSFCDVINHENANKGIIFTTSYFSPDAQKRQNEIGTILDLKNREDIIDWIAEYKNNGY